MINIFNTKITPIVLLRNDLGRLWNNKYPFDTFGFPFSSTFGGFTSLIVELFLYYNFCQYLLCDEYILMICF